MKILFYSIGRNNSTKNLEKDLLGCMPDISTGTVNSLKELSKNLCQPLNNIKVIVAAPGGHGELNGLIQMIPLLDNVKVILILPDRNQQTISLGTRLNASFLTYIDNDAKDIIAVLQKIQKNEQKPKKNNE